MLWTADARAREPDSADVLSVTWLTAPDCLQTEQLETEIARLVGAEVSREQAPSFQAQFSATDGGHHQLVLRTRSQAGESVRTVIVASCEQLRELTVVLIAATIDPHSAPADQLGSPAPQASAEPTLWQRRTWSLVVGALGDWQSWPRVSGGPLAGLSLALAPAWLWIDARYLLPRGADTEFVQVESRFQLFAAALGAARMWRLAGLSLGPCLELELGYLRGHVRGADEPTNGGAAWIGALGGGLFDQALTPRVSVQLRALFGVPFYRQQFGLVGEPPFHTTAPYTIRVLLGFRITLGPKTAAVAAIQKSVPFATH